ncbi:MAG: hypothetical protein PHY44_01970 [Lachnospiraceae bacterium]|nr:hypothetical protein [Lachnospiraceae bacterium]
MIKKLKEISAYAIICACCITTVSPVFANTVSVSKPLELTSQSYSDNKVITAEIPLSLNLAPDGKTLIRNTNLPANSKYFRYIQTDVPNWAYDAVYKSWSNNLIAQGNGITRYPSNPALSKVAYTPVDLQYKTLCDTKFGEAFWNSVVDQNGWKESYLPYDKENNVEGSEDDIMTQEEMFNNLVKQTTNVNYLEDTENAYAISVGNYINILSVTSSNGAHSVPDCIGYMIAQMYNNKDNKLITSSKFKVMKEAMWMPSDGNMISVYVPVYVKISCANYEPSKNWRQFAFQGSAFNIDPSTGIFGYPHLRKGETWEGVWQIKLMYDAYSKVYKMNAAVGNFSLQLSPVQNIYDGVRPDLDKTNEDTVYDVGSAEKTIYMKRHKDM